MVKRIILLQILSGFLWLLIGLNTTEGAYCCGIVKKGEFSLPPSLPNEPSSFSTKVHCYGAVFTPSYAYLTEINCTATYRIMGMKTPIEMITNNGGHSHNYDTHPLGELWFGGNPLIPYRELTWGTKDTPGTLTHKLPEVSGIIVTELDITSPTPWVCAYGCFTPDSRKSEYTFDVGIQGMERVEDSGDYHVVVRGGTDTHSEGTYGTLDTIKKLQKISNQYFYRTDRKLSINDISLPKGGLLDYKATWAPPHKEHRIGTDADINRKDGGGVFTNCWEDKALKNAVAKMAKGQSRLRLKCEDARGRPVPLDDPTGLYKHIDFD
jgi:hypothetical protein